MVSTGISRRGVVCVVAALTVGISGVAFGNVRAATPTDLARLEVAATAVANGILSKKTIDGNTDATLSGNAWRLQLTDGSGTYYFYAHLSAFAAGLNQGDTVTKGQLIGYVGDTGDPGPGNYHLHFEIHPKGGAAVDPYPLLTIPKSCSVYA